MRLLSRDNFSRAVAVGNYFHNTKFTQLTEKSYTFIEKIILTLFNFTVKFFRK